jgi:small-conductance mechanosensitive channel
MPEPKVTTDLIMAWYYSGLTALGGLLIGLVADYILHRYVRKLAANTEWEGDELIVNALASKMPLWGLLIGILVALPFTPLGPKVVAGLHKGAAVGLILSVTWVCANIASGLVAISAEGLFGGASTTIFRVLAKVGLWGIGLTIMLNQIGISIAPILTALGVGGLAVALALQDTLSNLFAGIHLILSRQVRVGDYIKLESSAEGTVTDINWRNTSILTLTHNMVVVPNSKLATAIVTNHHLPESEMLLHIPVSVSYKSDLAVVEKVSIEVARATQAAFESTPPMVTPFVRYNTFGESAIHFTVVFSIRQFSDQLLLRHEFIKDLHSRYRAEGIEIPLPQRVVRMISNADVDVDG